MKKLFMTILLIMSLHYCKGQSPMKDLRFILLIDGEIPIATIHDASITIIDSLNKKDEIPLEYQVGGLDMSIENYNKIISLNPKKRIEFRFKFRDFGKVFVVDRAYNRSMPAQCFTESYLIMKVYNYDKKVNRRLFYERKGYGIEYFIPSFGTVIGKKRQ